MALAVSSRPSEHSSPISKIISRLRRHSSKNGTKNQSHNTENIDQRPPLIPSPLPLVLPEHQQALSNLGWTTITFPPCSSSPTTPTQGPPTPGAHPLQSAYEDLFAASQAFFAQPADEKAQWKHRLGSEEGWSCIPGEKEFITLRTLAYCPEVLRAPAKRYWDLVGAHCASTLGRIGTGLGMRDAESEEAGLKQFVGPCARMQDAEEGKTASMLRLFRYEGWEAKEVAEAHADLGLLSVVVGNVPGLEVWDGAQWFAVEKEVEQKGGKGASLLVGRQLERLSNGRYPAGGHRVVSYGDAQGSQEGEKGYRFSIVFVLRAHNPVLIESDDLETEITGKWAEPVHGQRAGDLYAKIRSSHFNINVGMEERMKQRQNIRLKTEMGGSG